MSILLTPHLEFFYFVSNVTSHSERRFALNLSFPFYMALSNHIFTPVSQFPSFDNRTMKGVLVKNRNPGKV